ncbi:MAG: phage major capsid protein [Chloroflexi bacterium]|nr:phage major capsid protein [Chloroflexota bacterium]
MNAVQVREAALAKFLAAKALVGPDGSVPDRDMARFDALFKDGVALDRQYTALTGVPGIGDRASLDDRLGWYQGGGEGMHHGSGAGIVNRDGRVLVLGPGDRLAAHVPQPKGPQMGLGQLVRGMVYGDFGGYDRPMVQMGIGSASGGGYLVPTPLAARIIDDARAQAKVIRAGAQTIPMTSNTLRIARIESGFDGAGGWKVEHDPIDEQEIVFGAVTLTARTLAVMAVLSVELSEDSTPDATDVIRRALARALALELDRVALVGTGVAPQPKGVQNQSGVLTDTATPPVSYADFSRAYQAILEANHTPTAVIYSPSTWGVLDRAEDDVFQPKRPPASWESLGRHVTTQVPDDLAFTGDWSKLLIGVRTDLVIEASREASHSGGSAFRNLQVVIRAYLRADIAVEDASAFHVLDIPTGS